MAIEQNRNIVVVLSRRKHKTKQTPEHWLSSTKEMDFFIHLHKNVEHSHI